VAFLDDNLQKLERDPALGPPSDRLDADVQALRNLCRAAHILDGFFGGLALCFFHNSIGYTNIYIGYTNIYV